MSVRRHGAGSAPFQCSAAPSRPAASKFVADLSQIILARAIQEKRVLTLAKSFPAINAPGWNEFFGLVNALLDPSNSVVDGLAFSGEQNTLYVRCNEILLLNQIRFCREQIAAIP